MTTAAEMTAGHSKRVRSFRMHDDTWDLIADRGAPDAASAFVNDMTEAGLGYARCYRCFTLVPVTFGNLAGRPLGEWVAEAGTTVTRQKCRAHEPVTIGAAAAEKPSPARPEAPPGSAWLETDPDEIPRIEDVLNPRRRKGRDR